MSQQTNLNVAPYFDDFNPSNDYYKVLFKPGYPVQARELTTLQSILQNQIERFGQYFFKDGQKVIPGNTGYTQLYYAIQLENSYLGVPVSAYADQLIGAKITGKTSGVTAVVDKILLPQDSERGNLTLYINYISSSTRNNSTQQFLDAELLTANISINSTLIGNNTIIAGEPFATTIANNAAAVGSSFSISEGIYFVRGYFVKVDTETLILDQYSNKPNYRIGLYIDEQIVNSDIDEALNDNSQGFNNYAAPGADRLKISVFLFKKSLTDFNDNNFIELATVNDGVLRSKTETKDTKFNEELARRTYEESGDYVIKPFDVSIKESLNNRKGNNGLFNVGQFTYGGATPSNNLAVYQISQGKAYVRGYEVSPTNTTFLDVDKPRTTQTLENQSIIYNTGPTLRLNRVYGGPKVGLGNTFVLSLRDERIGSSSITESGKEIGLARVYDFKLESGSYVSNSNINEWHISLFDVQTFTNITLNSPITLSYPTYVKGNSSGAVAFLKDNVTVGTALTLYDVKGSFIPNESFSFNGIESGIIGIAVTSYGISDIKSVYGLVSAGSTFNADVIQTVSLNVGIATISVSSGGISTVRSSSTQFPGKLIKVGNLVQYSDLTTTPDPIVARVVSVGSSTISISGVTTVTGVVNGSLPSSSTLTVNDFSIISTNLESSEDNTLYTRLPKNNISNLDISSSTLTIRKNFTVNISGNKLSAAVTSGTNEIFLPFDEERYSLIRSDGSIEPLTSDKFKFEFGGTQLTIFNLGSDNTGATLTATLQKIKPKAKVKRKNRVNSIIVTNSRKEGSGIGGTTLNDGLVYGTYPYGTRVQDEIISLNVPDIIEIHGIFESSNTSNPSAPKAVLSAITSSSSTTSELIIGEEIIGSNSGAVAIVAEKLTSSQISFIYKNENRFKEGEILTFSESKIQGQLVTLESPSFDISSNYTFNNGQTGTFYDYGYISRKSDISEPSKRLKIYFSNGYYESTDDGDITTVNSYNTFDYSKEIPTINNIRNTDIIDIRPRISEYTTTESSRSPLEFYGRSFNSTSNSSTNVLASDESILTSFSFYLGRIDRIYLTKDGKFQIKYGVPSEKPEKPVSVDDALEIATINLPPYLYSTSQASIEFLEYKRYRMVDIKQLENRIKNLEYYTSLSLLETNTANLFVPDSKGFNKFKSGFFVDNFTTFLTQEDRLPIKNSIDIKNKELRPEHYTTSIDLQLGAFSAAVATLDYQYELPEGINVRKTGDIITLDYSEVEWLKQSFATRSESVTPFLISFWQATLELTPASDTWIDTARLEAKVINAEGNYAETLATAARTLSVDPQTGFAPTVWNSWVTNWTGQDIVDSTRTSTRTTEQSWSSGNGFIGSSWGVTTTTQVIEEQFRETRDTGIQSRTGTRTVVSEQFDRTSVGDRVVSRELVPYMRSRNIQFVSKKLKPLTQIYAFFDGKNVTKYCIPKLLEISMISGSFEVGETIVGTTQVTGLGDNWQEIRPKITFRVAQSNHKEGPYNTPTSTYSLSPYTNQSLQATYSSTSSILNIDTFSLSNASQNEFGGWVEQGMILVGKTSNARATVSNVRLISDLTSTLIGSFYIPDPNINVHPRFEAGVKTFTLVNSDTNDQNSASTIAEESFTSSGTIETIQENIISIRNARIENKQEFEERAVSRTTGSQLVNSKVISQTSRTTITGWYDPLAQSFLVDNETGVFLTRCDVFFRSKDDMDIPVTFQLRTMQGGFPTQYILPLSEVILNPDQVNTSSDGSVATTVYFKSPVYLEGGKEYCICLASNSTKYSVYISRIGENDLITQTFISNQPYLGSLFKSQNASTWEASQWEDLKFTLYRADFIENGSVEFYNPDLTKNNKQISNLLPDSLNFESKRIRVSISSTISDPGLVKGYTIIQKNTTGKGDYVGSAGTAIGSLTVTNSGIGYTPSSGFYTFNNVNLTTITGKGKGATADVSINNGVAVAATIVNGGNGYQSGDVVGISSIGSFSVGRNSRFSVLSISSINQLIIDNVQGDFEVGVGKTLQYITNSGITTLNNSLGGNITIDSIDVESDGLHVKVNHKNHGMYSSNNYVTISGAKSDIKPTKLVNSYAADSVAQISVENASEFSIFEGVGVGTTNPGYLLVGNEIIEYTSVSGNTIGGNIIRGDNPIDYSIGSQVYKYELNGVSLRRINTTHNLNDVSLENPVGLDFYNIKLDMSSNGINRTTGVGYSNLYQNRTKSAGGKDIKCTQNIPYEIITPIVHNVTVRGTSISSEIRTISNSSISGNEIPFIDNGFESISINQPNYLSSPRMICSKVNELNNLQNLPYNKSFNMRLLLGTVSSYLSPVIDTQRISTILTSNRVNKVIDDYATDSRVNSIFNDPTAFQYISKEISLETPATSIKVLLSAHINSYCDIRVFYSIGDNPGFFPIFTPFPGYNNLDARSQIISLENSDGLPDSFSSFSNLLAFTSSNIDYKEYAFTANNLPSFRNYRIKIIATSTNQVYVPRIKDLRVIALA